MSVFKVLMPKMGESVQEATITKMLVVEGDSIEEDQNLFEIATDKVDSEIPSPVEGTIGSILYSEGDIVPVGEIIIQINLEESNDESLESTRVTTEEVHLLEGEPKSGNKRRHGTPFLTPLVRSIIKAEKISENEIKTIRGSGQLGRIQKKDIQKFIKNKRSDKIEGEKTASKNNMISAEDTIVPMSRIRKVIAKHMVDSVQISPHVSTVVEVDVTPLVIWREKNKILFSEKYNTKLTYMHLFMKFVSKSLNRYPYINATVEGENIRLWNQINIGVAVATPEDNLVVPVVKNVNEKSLVGIVKGLNKLIDSARTNTLLLEDLQQGTFTITNFGSIGALFGTPIINQPQSAILATGSIEKKPCIVENELGDSIAIRHKMYLSLSYDHRIIDGMMAGKFLNDLKDQMESFNITTEI